VVGPNAEGFANTAASLCATFSPAVEASERPLLPPTHRGLPFHLDVATQDPRNMNPLSMGISPIYIYDPSTGKVDTEIVEDMLEYIPTTLVQYRVYTTERACQTVLAQACERALGRDAAGAAAQEECT